MECINLIYDYQYFDYVLILLNQLYQLLQLQMQQYFFKSMTEQSLPSKLKQSTKGSELTAKNSFDPKKLPTEFQFTDQQVQAFKAKLPPNLFLVNPSTDELSKIKEQLRNDYISKQSSTLNMESKKSKSKYQNLHNTTTINSIQHSQTFQNYKQKKRQKSNIVQKKSSLKNLHAKSFQKQLAKQQMHDQLQVINNSKIINHNILDQKDPAQIKFKFKQKTKQKLQKKELKQPKKQINQEQKQMIDENKTQKGKIYPNAQSRQKMVCRIGQSTKSFPILASGQKRCIQPAISTYQIQFSQRNSLRYQFGIHYNLPIEENVPRLNQKQKNFCLNILSKLKSHRSSQAFRFPVEPQSQGVPDYYFVVYNPMDLNTIQKKLAKDKYKFISQFHSDINLIFLNSYKYNLRETIYFQNTIQFQDYYQSILKQAFEKPEQYAQNMNKVTKNKVDLGYLDYTEQTPAKRKKRQYTRNVFNDKNSVNLNKSQVISQQGVQRINIKINNRLRNSTQDHSVGLYSHSMILDHNDLNYNTQMQNENDKFSAFQNYNFIQKKQQLKLQKTRKSQHVKKQQEQQYTLKQTRKEKKQKKIPNFELTDVNKQQMVINTNINSLNEIHKVQRAENIFQLRNKGQQKSLRKTRIVKRKQSLVKRGEQFKKDINQDQQLKLLGCNRQGQQNVKQNIDMDKQRKVETISYNLKAKEQLEQEFNVIHQQNLNVLSANRIRAQTQIMGQQNIKYRYNQQPISQQNDQEWQNLGKVNYLRAPPAYLHPSFLHSYRPHPHHPLYNYPPGYYNCFHHAENRPALDVDHHELNGTQGVADYTVNEHMGDYISVDNHMRPPYQQYQIANDPNWKHFNQTYFQSNQHQMVNQSNYQNASVNNKIAVDNQQKNHIENKTINKTSQFQSYAYNRRIKRFQTDKNLDQKNNYQQLQQQLQKQQYQYHTQDKNQIKQTQKQDYIQSESNKEEPKVQQKDYTLNQAKDMSKNSNSNKQKAIRQNAYVYTNNLDRFNHNLKNESITVNNINTYPKYPQYNVQQNPQIDAPPVYSQQLKNSQYIAYSANTVLNYQNGWSPDPYPQPLPSMYHLQHPQAFKNSQPIPLHPHLNKIDAMMENSQHQYSGATSVGISSASQKNKSQEPANPVENIAVDNLNNSQLNIQNNTNFIVDNTKVKDTKKGRTKKTKKDRDQSYQQQDQEYNMEQQFKNMRKYKQRKINKAGTKKSTRKSKVGNEKPKQKRRRYERKNQEYQNQSNKLNANTSLQQSNLQIHSSYLQSNEIDEQNQNINKIQAPVDASKEPWHQIDPNKIFIQSQHSDVEIKELSGFNINQCYMHN